MNSRRVVGGLIRFGLVILACWLVIAWVRRKVSSHNHVRVEAQAPPDSLGPGDMRIYNADSSVDVVLMGNKILAGLSSKTVAKIKSGLDESRSGDTSGFGGMVSQIVKSSVAGAIGTHAVFPLADIKDIHYADGKIKVQWSDGSDRELFSGTSVNHQKVSDSFNETDAKRFVDAVRARKGLPATP
ncbi:MAG TPA: hypothetical protein VGH04_13390 [Gemmatimonadaceae bacterium]